MRGKLCFRGACAYLVSCAVREKLCFRGACAYLVSCAVREKLCFRGAREADRGTRTLNLLITNQLLCQLSHIGTITASYLYQKFSSMLENFYVFSVRSKINDPDENRTRVTAVKGRCLNRLTTGPYI